MVEEARTLDVHELPGLDVIAREVQASGRPVRIVQEGEELAVLQPAKKPRRRKLPGKPVTEDDPFWNLIGIGSSSGAGDISSNKTKYLINALRSKYK